MSVPERCPGCDAARVPYPEADAIYMCGSYVRSRVGFVRSDACKHKASEHCKANSEAERRIPRAGTTSTGTGSSNSSRS